MQVIQGRDLTLEWPLKDEIAVINENGDRSNTT